MFRFRMKALAGIALVGGLVAAMAPVAHAVPTANGKRETLQLQGSDTIWGVMGDGGLGDGAPTNPNHCGTTKQGLSCLWNNDSGASAINTDKDTAYNTQPLVTTPYPSSKTVPASPDSVSGDSCANAVWNAGNPPANGSSAGVSSLQGAQGNNGCVDIARASRGPRTVAAGDSANDRFFAFALDSVSWSYFPKQNSAAPSNLTHQQVQDIFSCNAAGTAPKITNWNQVGGGNSAITRFIPQLGSGTRGFFISNVLQSGENANLFNGLGCNGDWPASNPLGINLIEENTGNKVTTPATAIYPYSQGNWTAQKKKVDPLGDVRGGAVLGKIDGVKPTKLKEGSGGFFGQRYVYNVVRTGTPSYTAALRFVGVDSTGGGFICGKTDHKAVNKVIHTYGFKSLPFKSTDATGSFIPSSVKSYCRLQVPA